MENVRKVFPHQANASRYVKNCEVKKTETVHKCENCSKVFRFRSQRKRHLKSHTDNKKCKCGRSFRRADYLSEHLATCSDIYESSIDFVPSFVEAHHEQFSTVD